MNYTIKIQKTEIIKKASGREWKQIGVKEQQIEYSNKTELVPEYGYTPEIEREVEVVTDVLCQTVSDLDLAAVIKAINKL